MFFLLWYYFKHTSIGQIILSSGHLSATKLNTLPQWGALWWCRPLCDNQTVKYSQAVTDVHSARQPPPAHARCLLDEWLVRQPSDTRWWCDPSLSTSKLVPFIYIHFPFAPKVLTCIQRTGAQQLNFSSAESSQWSFLTALSHCNCQSLLIPQKADSLNLDLSICFISSQQDSSSSTSRARQGLDKCACNLNLPIFKPQYFTFP